MAMSSSFLENFTTNENVVFGAYWSAKSPAEMHRLVDRAVLCANKWCRDLLQPIDAPSAHNAIQSGRPGRQSLYMSDDTPRGFLSVSHRAVHQFVKGKTEQGKLLDMAGHNFSPHLASLYTSVEVSRYALDIYDFADIFTNAMLVSCSMAYSNSVLNADTVTRIDACLAAFDTVGQATERPLDWSRWTVCGLTQRSEREHLIILDRTPSGSGHTSFVSYCTGLFGNHACELAGKVARGRQYDHLSSKQKQFVLGTLLLPQFYQANYIHTGGDLQLSLIQHYDIFAKALASGVDVNRPTPRSGCRTGYTVWQIYLLRLYDWFHMRLYSLQRRYEFTDKDAKNFIADLECLTNTFQLFLKSGADPSVVISGEDLIRRYPQDASGRKETFLSVVDIVEDLRSVAESFSASCANDPERIAVWKIAIAAFETPLHEAFAQRHAASRSALLSL
jgi:hypothetical protein